MSSTISAHRRALVVTSLLVIALAMAATPSLADDVVLEHPGTGAPLSLRLRELLARRHNAAKSPQNVATVADDADADADAQLERDVAVDELLRDTGAQPHLVCSGDGVVPASLLRHATASAATVSGFGGGSTSDALLLYLPATHSGHHCWLAAHLHPSAAVDLDADPAIEYWTPSVPSQLKTRLVLDTAAIDMRVLYAQLDRDPESDLESGSARVEIAHVASASSDTLSQLVSAPHVLWVERAPQFRPSNYYARRLLQSFGNTAPLSASPLGLGGAGEVVAIGDTGLDVDSCYFYDPAHAIVTYNHVNADRRKVILYDTRFGDAGDEVEGHGTHVSGTAAGSAVPGSPPQAADWNGMAPDAKIAFIDICGGDCAYLSLPPDLRRSYYPIAYAAGARLHSNSWGSVGNTYSLEAMTTDWFAWEHGDFLALFAAGNEGDGGPGSVGSPAVAKNVVAVGCSMSAYQAQLDVCCRNISGAPVAAGKCCSSLPFLDDYADTLQPADLAYFSSRGPTGDGRLKPAVVAPGSMLISARSDGDPTSRQCGFAADSAKDFALLGMQGTSMATPAVAGATAQLRQYLRTEHRPNTLDNPSAAVLTAMLTAAAQDMPTGAGVWVPVPPLYSPNATWTLLDTTPNMDLGYGHLQLNRVVPVDESLALWLNDTAALAAAGDSLQWCLTVDSSDPGGTFDLTVALAWTDYPSNPIAAVNLVNDIDLAVVVVDGGGGGQQHAFYGNNAGAAGDTLNPHERVAVRGIVGGSTVSVLAGARRVPHGPQPIAVVVVARASDGVANVTLTADVMCPPRSGCPDDCGAATCDAAANRCDCSTGTGVGLACASPRCPGGCTDADHGSCEADATCACRDGWAGPDCAFDHCIGNVSLIAATGDFVSQRDPDATYAPDSHCMWTLAPDDQAPNARFLAVAFPEFATEYLYDEVQISYGAVAYGPDGNDSYTIARLSGIGPVPTVYVDADVVTVSFRSDGYLEGPGFRGVYKRVACPFNCSDGHGVCDEATGTCACDDDAWFGPYCAEPVCGGDRTCSGHGNCTRGQQDWPHCTCEPGYAGPACELAAVPMPPKPPATAPQAPTDQTALTFVTSDMHYGWPVDCSGRAAVDNTALVFTGPGDGYGFLGNVSRWAYTNDTYDFSMGARVTLKLMYAATYACGSPLWDEAFVVSVLDDKDAYIVPVAVLRAALLPSTTSLVFEVPSDAWFKHARVVFEAVGFVCDDCGQWAMSDVHVYKPICVPSCSSGRCVNGQCEKSGAGVVIGIILTVIALLGATAALVYFHRKGKLVPWVRDMKYTLKLKFSRSSKPKTQRQGDDATVGKAKLEGVAQPYAQME